MNDQQNKGPGRANDRGPILNTPVGDSEPGYRKDLAAVHRIKEWLADAEERGAALAAKLEAFEDARAKLYSAIHTTPQRDAMVRGYSLEAAKNLESMLYLLIDELGGFGDDPDDIDDATFIEITGESEPTAVAA